MKIGLYSPYLAEHTGGGERYILSIAKCLEEDYEVDVVIDRGQREIPTIKERLLGKLNIPLANTNFIPGPFGGQGSAMNRWFFTKPYDVFYYLTDGSFFYSGARYNLVHIQVPLPNPLTNMLSKAKFYYWNIRIANSEFTKVHIERLWKIPIQYVHRVPCQVQSFKPTNKEPVILSVGRFFTGLHTKKHAILIDAFKKLYQDPLFRSWKLVLAGSLDPGDENRIYLEGLRKKAQGLPIFFAVDIPFRELTDWYGKAFLYWHAAGFGENEQEHPERFEHFGITTVEAMAAGCVPLVYNHGGQKEVVRDGINGRSWETVGELVTQTKELIQDTKKRSTLAQHAMESSTQYSEEAGCRQFHKILADIVR